MNGCAVNPPNPGDRDSINAAVTQTTAAAAHRAIYCSAEIACGELPAPRTHRAAAYKRALKTADPSTIIPAVRRRSPGDSGRAKRRSEKQSARERRGASRRCLGCGRCSHCRPSGGHSGCAAAPRISMPPASNSPGRGTTFLNKNGHGPAALAAARHLVSLIRAVRARSVRICAHAEPRRHQRRNLTQRPQWNAEEERSGRPEHSLIVPLGLLSHATS